MTRKQAIKEFKREGMIIPQSAVELAISDMEKLEKIQHIVDEVQLVEDCYKAIKQIKEVLEKE